MPIQNNNMVNLAEHFLDKMEEAERKELLNPQWRAPQGLMSDMMQGLRRVRRKEMEVQLRYYPTTGKQEPEFVVKEEYFFCPACQNKQKESAKFHWLDIGAETLVGPYCSRCITREIEGLTHEDGMTYGDSRVYDVAINKALLDAVVLFMAQTPDTPAPERVVRDRVTGLPSDEDDDLVF